MSRQSIAGSARCAPAAAHPGNVTQALAAAGSATIFASLYAAYQLYGFPLPLWRFRCLPRPPQSRPAVAAAWTIRRCSGPRWQLAPCAKCPPSVDSTVQKRRQHRPARSQAIDVRCEIVTRYWISSASFLEVLGDPIILLCQSFKCRFRLKLILACNG